MNPCLKLHQTWYNLSLLSIEIWIFHLDSVSIYVQLFPTIPVSTFDCFQESLLALSPIKYGSFKIKEIFEAFFVSKMLWADLPYLILSEFFVRDFFVCDGHRAIWAWKLALVKSCSFSISDISMHKILNNIDKDIAWNVFQISTSVNEKCKLQCSMN